MRIESQVEATEAETEAFPSSRFLPHPSRISIFIHAVPSLAVSSLPSYREHRGTRRRRSLSASRRCYPGDLGASLITPNSRAGFT